MNVLTRPTLM